jgi:hypothetical protein
MSEVSTKPVVTQVDSLWQGAWADGYTATVLEIDARRLSYKVRVRIEHPQEPPQTHAVDLLSPRSRQDAAATLAARNGTGPIAWDMRLSDLYTAMQEAQRRLYASRPRLGFPPLMPPLPASAIPNQARAQGAAPWLDAYASHSARWSPRGARAYHMGVGVWLLSAVAAGRIAVELGTRIYPNLFMAMVSDSTLYAKTTTATIGMKGLRQAHLGTLLAADRATPQALLRTMAAAVPDDFASKDDEAQLACAASMSFAGQRAWYYEEWGTMLPQMMRKDSPMAEFHGLLRLLDDGVEQYESNTIARGLERVNHPYLALLCSATPVDLAPFLSSGSGFWRDGFWPRFVFLTPLADEKPSTDRQPRGLATLSDHLLGALKDWHQRLRIPKATIKEVMRGKKGTGRYRAEVEELPCQILTISNEAFEAYYTYNVALITMVEQGQVSTDFNACYGRFHMKALRVAMLLASLAGYDTITLAHWARAQQIVEQWRMMLHQTVVWASTATPLTREAQLEEAIERTLARLGPMGARGLQRHIHDCDSLRINVALQAMLTADRISMWQDGRKHLYALTIESPDPRPITPEKETISREKES